MSRVSISTLLFLLMTTVFSPAMHAQEIRDQGFTHLTQGALMAEDLENSWTIEEVASGQYDSLFQPVTALIPNVNFTASTYWIKTSFTNQGTQEDFYVEAARPITNEVNYYELTHTGTVNVTQKSGDEIRFEARPIRHRNILFQTEIKPGETRHMIVSMRSDGEVINATLKLWNIEELGAFTQKENLFLGIYYGLLIFVLIIFGFFTIALKHRIYTFYVAYIFSLLLMQASLDGTAFQNLWPGSTWMANHSVLLFSSVSVLMMMLYAASFLTLKKMGKAYRNIYFSLGAIVAVCTLTSMTNGLAYELTFPIVNATSFLVLVMIITGIFIKVARSQRINPFFAVAFLCVLTGGLLFISGNLGLFFNEFITTNAIKLGSAAEVVFLSLAMAGRYRYIQRAKEDAQKESYNHLQTLNVITQNQNVRLEKLVVMRTAEIQEKSEQLEGKNKEIIDSITYAKRIQAAILPSDRFFKQNLENAFVLYLPKDIVAGDFYWMKRIDDVVLFAAADCTGHGVPGAMVSVICNSALNRTVGEFKLKEPAAILDKVAELVEAAFDQSEEEVKDGMDISLCAIHPAPDASTNSGPTLTWAGANNPLWIVSKHDFRAVTDRAFEAENAELFEIKPDKQPIGKFSDRKPFTQHQLELHKGDHIYIFSDGFADQFGGPKGKKYKSRNFKELLISITNLSMEDQHARINQEFESWQGDLEQIDDVCVIGLKV